MTIEEADAAIMAFILEGQSRHQITFLECLKTMPDVLADMTMDPTEMLDAPLRSDWIYFKRDCVNSDTERFLGPWYKYRIQDKTKPLTNSSTQCSI